MKPQFRITLEDKTEIIYIDFRGIQVNENLLDGLSNLEGVVYPDSREPYRIRLAYGQLYTFKEIRDSIADYLKTQGLEEIS
jgi:hypothetical protein